MHRLTVLTILLVGLVSAGCVSQGTIKVGDRGQLWQGTGNVTGPGTFVTERCPFEKTCSAVMVSSEAPGDEAYSFVFKVKHRALIGIPYGEEPVTVYVVGDKAECVKQSGPLKLSADAGDFCAGPVWIRR
jgi:hypothetical protein